MSEKIWQVFPKISSNLKEQLLSNRGLNSLDAKNFLHPHLLNLVSAEKLFPQLSQAVARIKKATKEKELIYIYGDFDVDGITASAILWETLDLLGANVLPYIPDRRSEGYGLNSEAVKFLADQGARVVITVDCGITAVEQARQAKALGIDLIITDHHQSQEILPEPFALLHTTTLAGSGVAFRLAGEILKEFGKDNEEQFYKNLELATLGTVADLVPLLGDNRILVSNGLTLLSKTSRLGLNSLYEIANIGKTAIDTYEIGFMISPRLNAMGRMESALDSLRLLLTRDKTRAQVLAKKLDETNKVRQEATVSAFEHALNLVQKEYLGSKLFVLSSVNYQEGIVGLVAGRITEKFHRPTAVISENSVLSKGSARSISNFNITQALSTQKHLLAAHGGHPMAAGFSVSLENIIPLREGLVNLAEGQLKEKDLQPILKIDAEIDVKDVDESLINTLKEFAPFGMANPEPTFLTKALQVVDAKTVGKENTHLKLVLKNKEGKLLEGVGFGLGEKKPEVGDLIDIVYNVRENYWNSRKRIEARIKDLKISPIV